MREEQEMRKKMVHLGTIPSEDLNRLEMDDKFKPSANLGSEKGKIEPSSEWGPESLDAKADSNLGLESLDMEHSRKLNSEPQDNDVTESKSKLENKGSHGVENSGVKSNGASRGITTESTKNDDTTTTATKQEKDKAEIKKISFLQGFLGKNYDSTADKIVPKNPDEHETTHRL